MKDFVDFLVVLSLFLVPFVAYKVAFEVSGRRLFRKKILLRFLFAVAASAYLSVLWVSFLIANDWFFDDNRWINRPIRMVVIRYDANSPYGLR